MCDWGDVGSVLTGGISDVAGVTDNDWGKDLVNIATGGTTNLVGLTDSNSDIVNTANMFSPFQNIDNGIDAYKDTGDWWKAFDSGFDLGGRVDYGAKKLGSNLPDEVNDIAQVVGPIVGTAYMGPVGAAAGSAFAGKMKKGDDYDYKSGWLNAGTSAATAYALQGATGNGWSPSGAAAPVSDMGPGVDAYGLDQGVGADLVKKVPTDGSGIDLSGSLPTMTGYTTNLDGSVADPMVADAALPDGGATDFGPGVDAYGPAQGVGKTDLTSMIMKNLSTGANSLMDGAKDLYGSAVEKGGNMLSFGGKGTTSGGIGGLGGGKALPILMAAGLLSSSVSGKQKSDQEDEYNQNLQKQLQEYLTNTTWNDTTRNEYMKGLMGNYAEQIAGEKRRAGANASASGRGGGYFGSRVARSTQAAREAVAKSLSETFKPDSTSPEVYAQLAKSMTPGLPSSNSFFSGLSELAGKWPYLALMGQQA